MEKQFYKVQDEIEEQPRYESRGKNAVKGGEKMSPMRKMNMTDREQFFMNFRDNLESNRSYNPGLYDSRSSAARNPSNISSEINYYEVDPQGTGRSRDNSIHQRRKPSRNSSPQRRGPKQVNYSQYSHPLDDRYENPEAFARSSPQKG